jgi:hypothetical protein
LFLLWHIILEPHEYFYKPKKIIKQNDKSSPTLDHIPGYLEQRRHYQEQQNRNNFVEENGVQSVLSESILYGDNLVEENDM